MTVYNGIGDKTDTVIFMQKSISPLTKVPYGSFVVTVSLLTVSEKVNPIMSKAARLNESAIRKFHRYRDALESFEKSKIDNAQGGSPCENIDILFCHIINICL